MINKEGEQRDPDIIKHNQPGSMSLLASPAAAALHGTHSRDPSTLSLQIPGKERTIKGQVGTCAVGAKMVTQSLLVLPWKKDSIG